MLSLTTITGHFYFHFEDTVIGLRTVHKKVKDGGIIIYNRPSNKNSNALHNLWPLVHSPKTTKHVEIT